MPETASRSEEGRLHLLSEVVRDFAEDTSDYARLLDTIARRLAGAMNATCVVCLLSSDGKTLSPVSSHSSDVVMLRKVQAVATSYRVADHPEVQATLRGAAMVDPPFEGEPLAPGFSTRSYVLADTLNRLWLPLRLRGKPQGILCLVRPRLDANRFQATDLHLAQILADHAALAIGHARSYEAEREARAAAEKAATASRLAERRFARLSESGLIGVLVGDNRGIVTEANPTVLHMLGYSSDEILSGRVHWKDLTPEEYRAGDSAVVEQLGRTGISDLREKEYIHKSGKRVPVLVGSAMLDGESTKSISFVLDMTERKAAAAAITHLREERAANATMRGVIESAPDALVIVDHSGTIVLANKRIEAAFGYSREELVGQAIEMLVPARYRAAHVVDRTGFFSEAAVRPMGVGLELFGLRKDGSEFPIEVSLAPLQTEQGLLVSSAIRDITERKRSDEQRARLAAIVDSSADAIIGKTLEGVITSWNNGAEDTFGYAASEAIGRSILLIIPPGREDEEAAILHDVAAGEVKQFDTVRRCKDGRLMDVSVTISPVRDSRGKVVAISKVARDITDRKRAEAALSRARDVAEAASAELEAFSYSVAHDLRAPLRGMNGFAQVLLDGYGDKFDADGRDWLEEILLNAQKMGGLIDALLGLSRVTRSELERDPIDLSSVALASIDMLRATDPARVVDVVVQDGLRAEADPTLVRALLDNLLANAWKFTNKVASARIEVGSAQRKGTTAFFVRDNGAGFDMAYASKLFAPFQRLHSAVEFPGTGIGLATVLRIVRRHGGELWAEGAVDQGATFYFTFQARMVGAAA